MNSGSSFYNYKGTFSLVLLAVCDARYRYILVDIGDEGHQNDNGVFSNSDFGIALLDGKHGLPQPEKLPNSDLVSPYVLVRDSIFSLNKSLMHPFVGRFLPESERIFKLQAEPGQTNN